MIYGKKMLNKLRQYLWTLVILLVPWQARWIYQIMPPQFYNEFIGVSLYIIDILIFIGILLCIKFKKINIKSWWWLMLGYGLVCSVFALWPIILWHRIIALTVLVLAFYCIKKTLKPDSINVVIIISAVVQAILAILQFFTQAVWGNKWLGMSTQDAGNLGVSVVELGAERWLRAYGSFGHPNILGGFLVVAWLCWWQMFTNYYENEIKLRNRYLYLTCGALILVGLYLTFSRAALLALVISSFVYACFSGRKNWYITKKVGFLFMTTTIVMACVVGNMWFSRTNVNNRLEEVSINERVGGYSEALEIWQKNKLLGVGLGQYVPHVAWLNYDAPAYKHQPVHNTWVLIFVELGLVGSLIFVFVLKRSNLFKNLTPLKISLIVAVLVIGLFDHYLWSLHSGWLILWLAILSAQNPPLDTPNNYRN